MLPSTAKGPRTAFLALPVHAGTRSGAADSSRCSAGTSSARLPISARAGRSRSTIPSRSTRTGSRGTAVCAASRPGRRFHLLIERTQDGWTLDGARNGLADITDLDCDFHPRHQPAGNYGARALAIGERAEFSVAWFDVGKTALVELPQIYERLDETHYHYISPPSGYEATLEMDETGFVKVYPDLWAMETGADLQSAADQPRGFRTACNTPSPRRVSQRRIALTRIAVAAAAGRRRPRTRSPTTSGISCSLDEMRRPILLAGAVARRRSWACRRCRPAPPEGRTRAVIHHEGRARLAPQQLDLVGEPEAAAMLAGAA